MASSISLLFLCCLFVAEASAGAGTEWSYEGEHSPATWYKEYYHCGGKKQSPIDIETNEVILNGKLGKLKMTGYDTLLRNPTLTNNGHSAQINLDADMYVEEGGLPAQYKAAQFHFHWGLDDRRGSEHTINGSPQPMEMHIVHYSMEYANLSEAVNKPDGLAVLGVLYEIVDQPNANFEHIVSNLKSPVYKGETLNIEDLTLDSLLPANRDTFFRYSGSLTTPPCYESVVWTIFLDRMKISQAQLNKFRDQLKANAKNQPEVQLVNDFRPVQNLGVRLVETNTEQGLSGSGQLEAYFAVLFCGIILAIF